MRKYLKDARVNLGYTQSQVAEIIGVSQNYYCDIENEVRQREMKASMMLSLSEILKIPISEFLEYERQVESKTT